jgi:hypothetical protein
MSYKKTIADTNEFLNQVANIYQHSMRIFMEYIDNSLDSAETLYNLEKKYPYPIEIQVAIDPKNKTVTFSDNCVGMDKGFKSKDENGIGIWKDGLLAIVTSIGKSNKKAVSWLNGQFGFGSHAYMACADKMSILTAKKEMDKCLYIELFSNTLIVEDEKKLPKNKLVYGSGTVVTLSGFKKEWWSEVDPGLLKEEIEKHFEQLLARPNLTIKVVYGNEEEICQAFNYDNFLGAKIKKDIASLRIEKKGVVTTKKLESPIKIYLKVTDEIILNKRPIFINKGRRIEEVQNIKSFLNKSKYRSSLWGHSNLTGYIDVNGLVSPTLPRDDFQRSESRAMLYEELLSIEDEVFRQLVEINKKSEDAGMGKLEDILAAALSQLSKQYNLKFKTELVTGGDVNLKLGDEDSSTFKQNSEGGFGNKETGSDQTEDVPIVETIDESDMKGKEKRKNGFPIKFSDREQKKSDGTLLRSQFIEGEGIIIYNRHPDFQSRARINRYGERILTQRLISYLASQVVIRFKDKFFEKRGKQPEVQSILSSRTELFDDLTDGVYQFESILQPWKNKNLSNLENSSDEHNNYEEE